MVKLMNSRLGLMSLVTSVAIGLFALVGSTYAVLVCQTVPDPDSGSSDDSGDDGVEVTGSCDGVTSTIKYYLLQAGYDDNAASGIMGNLSAESCGYRYKVVCSCSRADVEDGFKAYIQSGSSYTLNSSMTRSCGFGLVQWTPDSNKNVDRLLRLQKYADSKGGAITDLNIQIEFIIKELTTTDINAYYYNVLRPDKLNGRTLEDTTWRVEKWYEAPGSVSGSPGYGQVNKVCENASSSWCKSFKKRLERAQQAKQVNGNCNPTSGGDSDDSSGDDSDGSDGDSSGPDQVPQVDQPSDDQPTTTQTGGALGKQNVNNMVGQYDSGIKDVVWRTDGSTVSASGCSLVSVVNSARALGASQSSVNVSTLASWSKRNISSASWGNLITMAKHIGLTVGSELWSSKSTSESTKIAQIRSVLASGGVVIAGGDRAGTDSSFCTTARKNSGECVFTPGGHFVAIIGITADNKLVVANPAKANNRTWIFPASGVLKYSNKARMVRF